MQFSASMMLLPTALMLLIMTSSIVEKFNDREFDPEALDTYTRYVNGLQNINLCYALPYHAAVR